ncbi:MAG: CDP-glucose 4,6-dehydratase [Candidatus Caenarcaniphilales bacterium]|nr:CDP-glucose 4,6-dehydratase [Candidatus Caenarcaniphilales bacterium]
MNINKTFWQGKKVFITGCTGFKGSWLSLILLNLGANLKGYSLAPPTQPSLFVVSDLQTEVFSIEADIRDSEWLEREIIAFQPEIVLHLAAQPLVLRSYENPLETYETNVIGTVNLFEACRKAKSVRVILNVTSDKCYENKEWVWGYRENDELGGFDPYSSSKACAELVTRAYLKSFFNPQIYNKHQVSLASVRAGNVIGGGDWANNRLIPDAVRAFSKSERLIIRRPHSTRPWQHVLEPLRGYLMLCEMMYKNGKDFSGAYNFGPFESSVCTVKEAISKFCDLWGDNCSFEMIEDSSLFHEAGLLKLDISKVKNKLSWKPSMNLKESLKETAAWYKCFYQNPSQIKELTLKQINGYL